MYKFIQKNQKKFLAIFGVLLMIVFILPTSFKNSLSRGDLTIGSVNGEKITGNELGQARSELEFLHQKRFLPLYELGSGPNLRASVSVFDKYFRGDDGALAYLLLQKEAEKEGFVVSTQAADATVASVYKGEALTQEQLDQLTPAVGRFMLVQAAFERASESVKASKPLVRYFMAEGLQTTKLNLVEYSAADLEKSIPAPTPEQVRQQYEQYGDKYPGSAFLTTQPAAPGFKVPDRVKLQYLKLPHAAVIESVLNELSPDELYRFDRDTGYPYYEKHQSEFPTPATRPVYGPVLPTPTTKPFPEVAGEIRKRLLTDASLSSSEEAAALRTAWPRAKSSSGRRYTMSWSKLMPSGRRPMTARPSPRNRPLRRIRRIRQAHRRRVRQVHRRQAQARPFRRSRRCPRNRPLQPPIRGSPITPSSIS